MQNILTLLMTALLIPSAFAHNERKPIVREMRPYDSTDFLSDEVERATRTAAAALSVLKSQAENRKIILTKTQIHMASDLLMGYYAHREGVRKRAGANIIWTGPRAEERTQLNQVIRLVVDFIDKKSGEEWLTISEYTHLEPELVIQKVKEQKKKFVVLDDVAEFNRFYPGEQETPEGQARYKRAAEYSEWMFNAPEDITFIVIDENFITQSHLKDETRNAISFIMRAGQYMTLACNRYLMN